MEAKGNWVLAILKRRNGYRCLLVVLLISGCARHNAAKQSFFDEKLSCPSPAIDQFEAWGQSGSQHVCKVKHGPFVAFENGYVHIRGQYDNGKEAGVWRWYGEAGKVEKEIDYSRKQ